MHTHPPDDWVSARLGDLATISRGASPRPIASPLWFSESSEVGWVRISDLGRSDGRLLSNTTQRLSPAGIARSRFVPPGTLIMSIAATVGIPVITGIPACIHDGFVAIEQLRGVDQQFLLYLLKSLEADLRAAGQTGSQANVNTGIVGGLTIAVPPVDEQRRISDALTAVDDQIGAVQVLIAKKEDIKRGLMQDLLTGRTRLPGFGGEWVSRSMASLGETYGGLTGKSKEDFGKGNCCYVPFMAVMRDVRVTAEDLPRVRIENTERQRVVMDGDLLFNTSSETPEELAMAAVASGLPPSTYLNSFCFGLRLALAANVDPFFIAYTFRSSLGRKSLSALAQGATRYNLSRARFRQIELRLPDLEEQKAIVRVLSDADRELAALRARVVKARDIKQGLMQELLTGRTRLPVASPTELAA